METGTVTTLLNRRVLILETNTSGHLVAELATARNQAGTLEQLPATGRQLSYEWTPNTEGGSVDITIDGTVYQARTAIYARDVRRDEDLLPHPYGRGSYNY